GGDAKFRRSFRQKRTARMLLKNEAERAAAPMRNRKGAYGEILCLEELACLKLDQVDLNGQALITQHDIEQQRMNPIQRGTAAVNIEGFDAFPPGKGRHQAAQPQIVIEVSVCEQDAVQSFEADAAAQNLALCAFAAVDQETVFTRQNRLRRQPTLNGWGGRRRAKEDDFKHRITPVMGK